MKKVIDTFHLVPKQYRPHVIIAGVVLLAFIYFLITTLLKTVFFFGKIGVVVAVFLLVAGLLSKFIKGKNGPQNLQ